MRDVDEKQKQRPTWDGRETPGRGTLWNNRGEGETLPNHHRPSSFFSTISFHGGVDQGGLVGNQWHSTKKSNSLEKQITP